MNDKELHNEGWWITTSPLARLNPEEWICSIYKRGRKAWITETCKGGFKNPIEAQEWAFRYLRPFL